MLEAILTMTPTKFPTQFQTDNVSWLRAVLFGAIVPPLLATAAFLLLRAEMWTVLLNPFFLLLTFVQMSLFVSVVCSPFGVFFALLCGLLTRVWLRQGNSLTDVQVWMSSVGAVCGLVTLYGIEKFLNGGRLNIFASNWPPLFWGAALVVGAICGWLLPQAVRIPRSQVASSDG